MKSIAAGPDPGTDHRVIVTTGGKGIIVRKKNPNPANPPQSMTNPKKPQQRQPKAEMRNAVIMEDGAGHSVTVIPAGVVAIVHKIHERLAIIKAPGMVHLVPVIRGMAAETPPERRIVQ